MTPLKIGDVTGNHRATIHSYTVRTPWHTVVIDTCVGNDKPRDGVEPWHMRGGPFMADLSAPDRSPPNP